MDGEKDLDPYQQTAYAIAYLTKRLGRKIEYHNIFWKSLGAMDYLLGLQ